MWRQTPRRANFTGRAMRARAPQEARTPASPTPQFPNPSDSAYVPQQRPTLRRPPQTSPESAATCWQAATPLRPPVTPAPPPEGGPSNHQVRRRAVRGVGCRGGRPAQRPHVDLRRDARRPPAQPLRPAPRRGGRVSAALECTRAPRGARQLRRARARQASRRLCMRASRSRSRAGPQSPRPPRGSNPNPSVQRSACAPAATMGNPINFFSTALVPAVLVSVRRARAAGRGGGPRGRATPACVRIAHAPLSHAHPFAPPARPAPSCC